MAEYIGHSSSSEIKEAVRGQLHILWPLLLEGLIALDYRFSLESLPQMRHLIKLDLFDPEELSIINSGFVSRDLTERELAEAKLMEKVFPKIEVTRPELPRTLARVHLIFYPMQNFISSPLGKEIFIEAGCQLETNELIMIMRAFYEEEYRRRAGYK